MKVILRENVEKLGNAGDVVSVAQGYARNFLLPKKKVLLASEDNLKLVAALKKSHEAKASKEKETAIALAAQLNEVTVVIEAKAGEEGKLFGTVTPQDIVAVLEGKGFSVDKKKIEITEPLKSVGDFSVSLSLYHEIKATVKVRIVAKASVKKESSKGKKKKAPAKKKTA